jgi:undecaprenyl-diphosphatase
MSLTYAEMIVVGLVQGVSELFPVSSLGHSVLFPALVGGSWARDLEMGAPGSPYLDSLVAMHVATALALVICFWGDWVRIVGALISSVRDRRIVTVAQRLAWLLVVATVPVGLAGLALDKVMRVYLSKPVPASLFLAVNGVVLFTVERLYRRQRAHRPVEVAAGAGGLEEHPGAGQHSEHGGSDDARLARLGWGEAIAIGACQILALLPGISRSGVTIAGGLLRGLSHRDAARFAFLLATPVIAAAGVLKIPELARPEMHSAIGPVAVGSLVAGVSAYFSARFLIRYFHTRTLTPFAIYCAVAGLGCLTYFSLA